MIEGYTAEDNRLEYENYEEREILVRILHEMERFMSGLTDLQAAIDANTAATTAAVAALGSIGDSDAAVEAASVALGANTAALTAATPIDPPV